MPDICPCGHVLYWNESVLCQDCIDRIEMEVQVEMMLAGEPFYGQEHANNERCKCGRLFSDCEYPDCR